MTHDTRSGRATDHWHRRVVATADPAGALVALTFALLVAHALTQQRVLEIGIYVVALAALAPCLGPFLGSLWRNAANVTVALLFGVLFGSMAAALIGDPSTDMWLRAKALGATGVWASIYVVMFLSARTPTSVSRLTRWLHVVGTVVSLSVCAGALAYLVGWRFGEIIQQGDGTFRAFGPLGDQVGFVVVLPALMCLAGRRPLLFGLHLSALLLTATRGAIGCLVVGVVIHLLFGASRTSSRYGWGVRSVAVVAVGAVLFFSPVADTLKSRFSARSMRWDAVQAGLDVVQENPWIGVGFNGLDANRAAVAEDWLMPTQAANGLSRAQNQYIQTAVDGGVGALLLLLLFAVFSIRNAARVMRWKDANPDIVGAQVWLIALLVGNHTSLWLLSGTPTGFVTFAVAGLAAGASLIARRDQPDVRERRVRRRPAILLGT